MLILGVKRRESGYELIQQRAQWVVIERKGMACP
jgi:hypothetical protein